MTPVASRSFLDQVISTLLYLDVCIKELRLSYRVMQKIVHFWIIWLVHTKNMIWDGVDKKMIWMEHEENACTNATAWSGCM